MSGWMTVDGRGGRDARRKGPTDTETGDEWKATQLGCGTKEQKLERQRYEKTYPSPGVERLIQEYADGCCDPRALCINLDKAGEKEHVYGHGCGHGDKHDAPAEPLFSVSYARTRLGACTASYARADDPLRSVADVQTLRYGMLSLDRATLPRPILYLPAAWD